MIPPNTIGSTDELELRRYRKSGAQQVIGALFTKYNHLVYGLCLKYLQNRDDAQDATMSIFESISETLKHTEIAHFKSWLYMVSKNHCLMTLRRKDSKNNQELIMEIPDDVHLYREEKIVLEERLDGLEECLEELNEEQMQCVFGYFIWKEKAIMRCQTLSELEAKR